MKSKGQIVSEMLAAWASHSIDEILGYFTQDAVCHAMPTQPLVGKAAIREGLQQIFNESTVDNFETLNQLEHGNWIMNERLDHFIIEGTKVALPVAGVFMLEGDKIKLWRDYFDPAVLVPPSQKAD